MNRTNIFFGESHSDWLPVRGGESGDFVFRRGDGHAFAKIAPASRRGELAGERDRLIWLKGRGVACPEVINWQEEQEGACLVITAIPGVPAGRSVWSGFAQSVAVNGAATWRYSQPIG